MCSSSACPKKKSQGYNCWMPVFSWMSQGILNSIHLNPKLLSFPSPFLPALPKRSLHVFGVQISVEIKGMLYDANLTSITF